MRRITRIYELGTAHCQKLDVAKRIIDNIAKYDPHGLIKIQYYCPRKLATINATFKNGVNQREVLNRYSLSPMQAQELLCYAKDENGLLAGATLFNTFEEPLFAVDFLKIASPDAVDYQMIDSYMNAIDSGNLPLFISTGGMSYEEMGDLFGHLPMQKHSRMPITPMFCLPEYPQRKWFFKDDFDRLNFMRKVWLNTNHSKVWGYSDHSGKDSWEYAINLMAALGATAFEKHVELEGRTHHDTAVCMAATKRNIERFVEITEDPKNEHSTDRGDPDIRYTRKYWVCLTDIKKGENFAPDNTALKRCMYPELIERLGYLELIDGTFGLHNPVFTARDDFKAGDIIVLKKGYLRNASCILNNRS